MIGLAVGAVAILALVWLMSDPVPGRPFQRTWWVD